MLFDSTAMRVRLMTYNIKSGRYRPGGLQAVLDVIETHAPDVLAVQEIDEGLARTGRVSQTDWLARKLKMHGLFAPALAFDEGWYGIALLSRWPLRAHQRRLLFRPQYADASVRPRHDSEQRVMLGAIVAPSSDPLARQGSEDGELRIKLIVTHLGLTDDQRSLQAREVVDFARSWGDALPTFIAGDFNCEPEATELAPLRQSFQEACACCGIVGEARYTFPSGPPGARTADGWRGAIDHLWVSPDVRVMGARVIHDETQASDHQPLLLECEI